MNFVFRFFGYRPKVGQFLLSLIQTMLNILILHIIPAKVGGRFFKKTKFQ